LSTSDAALMHWHDEPLQMGTAPGCEQV